MGRDVAEAVAGSAVETFAASELLANLSEEALADLAGRAGERTFAAGEVIFDRDAPGDSLHIVCSGTVDIRTDASADAARLDRLGAGRAFGELAVLDPAPRSAAAVAVDEVRTIEVSRSDLAATLANRPEDALALAGSLARSVTRGKEQVTLINHFLDQRVRERTAELRETQLEVIRRLGRAAEFRDEDTGAHIFRMSNYAMALARAAGFGEERAELLLTSAPMHDVGKIGVPDRILLKPGPLEDDEWEVMRSHTIMGASMLTGSRSEAIKLAQRIALQHHERWDGRGYPHGIAGEDIIIEARICTIADVFDALTSKRPYKEPWSFDDALEEIDKGSGTMFDPDLATIFTGIRPELERIAGEAEQVAEAPTRSLATDV